MCLGFERVAEGMPEIQNPAQTGFLFIGGNHFRLDPHRFGDQTVHQIPDVCASTSSRCSAKVRNSGASAITPALIIS